MSRGHHPPCPLHPPPLRLAYMIATHWPHVMYAFYGLLHPLSKGLMLFQQPSYMQDLPISPVSATFSENGDHVGSYLSSDCSGNLQETTYPQITSLPVEDTFNHRWSGYALSSADPLL